jgi:hypothetical protein
VKGKNIKIIVKDNTMNEIESLTKRRVDKDRNPIRK